MCPRSSSEVNHPLTEQSDQRKMAKETQPQALLTLERGTRMALPQHILNRLQLGGAIAAEVQATQADYRAWVYCKF